MNLVAAEATSSTSFVDLATKDELTLTLPAPGDVSVFYNATVSYAGACANEALFDKVLIDGVEQAGSEAMVSAVGAGIFRRLPNVFVASGLGAGAHTVTIRHRVEAPATPCATTWQNRVLIVQPGAGLAHAHFPGRLAAAESATVLQAFTPPDGTTVTLPTPVPVTFLYNASVLGEPAGTWCNGTTVGAMFVDGVLADGTHNGLSDNAYYLGGGEFPIFGTTATLSAGPHTLEVLHRTDDYCTKTWGNRTLIVEAGNDIASNEVRTSEGTVSATFTDLATPDVVTFLLHSPETVFVFFNAAVGAVDTYTYSDALEVDGTIIPESEQRTSFSTGGFGSLAPLAFPLQLGAGKHTVKVVHRAVRLSGTSGNAPWGNRQLVVLRAMQAAWNAASAPRVVAASPAALALAWSPLHGAAGYRATYWDGIAWVGATPASAPGITLTNNVGNWWRVEALSPGGSAFATQYVLGDWQTSLSPGPAWPSGTLTDDFSDDVVDPLYVNARPGQVSETAGYLQVTQEVTDEPSGFAIPWDPGVHRYQRVALRVLRHRANAYFDGSVLLAPYSNRARAVTWGNVYDDYTPLHGSVLTYTPSLDTTGTPPAASVDLLDTLDLQDAWVSLEFLVDSVTGSVRLFQDGAPHTVQTTFNGGKMLLCFSPWGWYTGHYLRIDDLVMESRDTPY